MIKKLAAILLFVCIACSANAGALHNSADTPLALQGFLGGFDALDNGNFLVNDGYTINEIDSSGASVRTLYTYNEEGGVWGSFVKHNNGRIYFGESMNGNVYSCSYDNPADVSPLAKLNNNFDIAFYQDKPYIAATALDYSSTSIYLVDNGAKDLIVDKVSGPAGPVAFDSSGNLYYAQGMDPSLLFKWNADLVAGAIGTGKITASPSESLAPIAGPYGLAITTDGNMYYTTNSGAPRVVKLNPNGTYASELPFDTAAIAAMYSDNPLFSNIESVYMTNIAYNSAANAISAAVSYTVVSYTDDTYTAFTRTPYTVISTVAVPEPTSVLALCTLIGLTVSPKLLRLRSK